MSAFDPVLLAVLANRMETIVGEMENTLLRTGRSAVLNMARDFSCAIVTGENELVASGHGLPVHVIGTEFMTKAMQEVHPDLREGDAVLHNDPYLGNTHPADHTILVPVFWDGVHVFTTAAKAHQADCGNAEPTSYMPYARDVYEEGGLVFPAVLVQREYADIGDVIRTCRSRIRVPDQWYGDYLAMLGAARIGERALKELCARYGLETIARFLDEWFDYSERCIREVIRRLPKVRFSGEGRHDPFGDLVDGIPVKVDVEIDPDQELIEVDLRDNIDCVPAGVNESRACTVNNVLSGIFNSIDPDIPHNAGTFRRIRVHLRENCVVGIPRFPHSCSLATTNVGERLVVTTQRAFANAIEGHGLAEGACGMGPSNGVISGIDPRHGDEPYVNQKVTGCQGGPGGPETDGWLTYGNAVTDGLMFRDSVEIDEQKYPIRIHEMRVREDSEGSGRRRGAPGVRMAFGPRLSPMTSFYFTDGLHYPPRGARGGGDAAPSLPFRITPDGDEVPIDGIGSVTLEPGELLLHLGSGGGGYEPPFDREPELVRADVLRRFVSFRRAREVYGVIFAEDVRSDHLTVDFDSTEELRSKLRLKASAP